MVVVVFVFFVGKRNYTDTQIKEAEVHFSRLVSTDISTKFALLPLFLKKKRNDESFHWSI